MYIRRVICLKTLLKLGNCYNSEDIDFRSMNERWKREIFPFKTLFEWFRYDFSFSRYRGAKSKVIFNCLLCLSSSLSRVALTYPKLQTSDRQAISGKTCAKEVVHISRKKKCRSVSRDSIHNSLYYIALSGMETLSLCNRLRYRDESMNDLICIVSK